MSPKVYDPQHSIARDVEDLGSLPSETGARFVFGLSSGAMIVLEGLKSLPAVDKAAVYEPPFYLSGISQRLIERFNQEIDQGQLASALVTAARIVKLGPRLLAFVPRFLLRLGTTRLLRNEAIKGSGAYTSFKKLISAMRNRRIGAALCIIWIYISYISGLNAHI